MALWRAFHGTLAKRLDAAAELMRVGFPARPLSARSLRKFFLGSTAGLISPRRSPWRLCKPCRRLTSSLGKTFKINVRFGGDHSPRPLTDG